MVGLRPVRLTILAANSEDFALRGGTFNNRVTGESDTFGSAKSCLVYLWVHYLVQISVFLGLLTRKFHRVIAWLSFSQSISAQLSIKLKPLASMYHSIFWGIEVS